MVKRINEGGNVVTSMPIDDDEDPSASIDALVGMYSKKKDNLTSVSDESSSVYFITNG